VIPYAIAAESAVEADVEAAFDWFECEAPGLGFEFLEELAARIDNRKVAGRNPICCGGVLV
jgi:hypothetical protein